MSFQENIRIAQQRWRDIKTELSLGTEMYSMIFNSPSVSGPDWAEATKSALGTIPVIGDAIGGVAGVLEQVARIGEGRTLGTSVIAYNESLYVEIDQEIDRLEGLLDHYNAMETEELTRGFALQVFPQPIKPLTWEFKARLRYAQAYQLTRLTVRRLVTIRRTTINDCAIGKLASDIWEVASGLTPDQEKTIYDLFGGGKHFNYSRMFKLMLEQWKAVIAQDLIGGLKAGWELAIMNLQPVRSPQDLHRKWFAPLMHIKQSTNSTDFIRRLPVPGENSACRRSQLFPTLK